VIVPTSAQPRPEAHLRYAHDRQGGHPPGPGVDGPRRHPDHDEVPALRAPRPRTPSWLPTRSRRGRADTPRYSGRPDPLQQVAVREHDEASARDASSPGQFSRDHQCWRGERGSCFEAVAAAVGPGFGMEALTPGDPDEGPFFGFFGRASLVKRGRRLDSTDGAGLVFRVSSPASSRQRSIRRGSCRPISRTIRRRAQVP
jgi:hypothetical protein